MSGVITTFAGTGTQDFSGDGGPAIRAMLNWPRGVAVDSKGNVYIADTDNNRIRRVSPDSLITTFAGTGTKGFSGDGGPATQATLDHPYGITVDAAGVVYIADNQRIRQVGPAKISRLTSDFNGDDKVDFDDFFLFASAFGQKATGANAKFDLDSDGEIGFGDFFLFAEKFGQKA